jgi:hypothetical protein
VQTVTFAIFGLIAIPVIRAAIVFYQIDKEKKEQKWSK